VAHPGARRYYEEAVQKPTWRQPSWRGGFPATHGRLLTVPYLTDNHYAILQAGSKLRLSRRGHCSARRLSRNRSLRLHGVLKMLGGATGLRLLTLKNGFCG
jgi:hypothetical protein